MSCFGPHVDRVWDASGRLPACLAAAVRHARGCGFDLGAAQVFVSGPRQRRLLLGAAQAAELRAYLQGPGAPRTVLAHGTYLDAPWGGGEPARRAAEFVRREAALCAEAGIGGLVVHLGAQPPAEVERALPMLLPVQGEQARILLEVPHLRPARSHYDTPEKLLPLFAAVRRVDPGLSHFGFCADTAHVWSCGTDVSTYAQGLLWTDALERAHAVMPPERVALHLNDSASALGSGVDKHAPLGRGNIWGDFRGEPARSGLAAFVEYAARHGTPAILERKDPVDPKAHPGAALAGDYEVLMRLRPALKLNRAGAADL